MPEFTVIQGGGNGLDFESEVAQQAFEQLIIEALRAIARGDDRDFRVVDALIAFTQRLDTAKTPLPTIIQNVFASLHERTFSEGEPAARERDLKDIVRASLKFAAETMALDSAARGRLSSRRSDLTTLIEHYVIGREERARENANRSYLSDLAERHLGKWKPLKQASQTKRIARKKKSPSTVPRRSTTKGIFEDGI